jgi:hypothetical protein
MGSTTCLHECCTAAALWFEAKRSVGIYTHIHNNWFILFLHLHVYKQQFEPPKYQLKFLHSQKQEKYFSVKTVKISIMNFWVITLCSLIGGYQLLVG